MTLSLSLTPAKEPHKASCPSLLFKLKMLTVKVNHSLPPQRLDGYGYTCNQ